MPDPTQVDRRCRRAARCVRREKVVTRADPAIGCPCGCHGRGPDVPCDADGGCHHLHTAPTETITYLGALLEQADGWCPACAGRLGLALDELPRLYAQLSLLHLPSLAVRYRTDDITGSADLAPPIPINQRVDALARLLDWEITTWAELVADTAGLPWDSALAAASRPGHRIQQGCQLLGYRIVQWLAIGPREYLARSLGEQPFDGYRSDDPRRPVHDEGAWWVCRDGLDAAAVVLDLHHQVIRLTGGGPADHIPVPCGYCSNRTLRRDHHSGVVRCRTCGDTKTDDGHDAFVSAALAAYAQQSDVA